MNSDELALIEGMFDRIQRLSSWHCRIEGYYEGSSRVRDLGVAIPPELQRVQTVVSWPGIAVDALEERLDWLGWTNGDGYGLDGVYAANRLSTASCDVHLDALIFGLSFVAVCRLFVLVVSVVQPELPDGRDWCGETRRWWRVWGEDPRAGFVSDEEWLFLMDAAVIHDVVWREGRADLVASLRAHVKAFMGMLDRYSVDVVSGGRGGGSAVAMIDRYRKRQGA